MLLTWLHWCRKRLSASPIVAQWCKSQVFCSLAWVAAASLILTSYWSSVTAHAIFSWLKMSERSHWTGGCTEERKNQTAHVKLEAHVSNCLILSLLLFIICFCFHFQGERHLCFLFTQPSMLSKKLKFSSLLRQVSIESNSFFLFLSLSQMAADGHKAPNRKMNLFYLWLAKKVWNFPSAEFISAI